MEDNLDSDPFLHSYLILSLLFGFLFATSYTIYLILGHDENGARAGVLASLILLIVGLFLYNRKLVSGTSKSRGF